MANKRQKLESELVRARNNISWEKVKDSVKLLVNKHGSSDPMLKLVKAEIDFELYLQEHEPRGSNVANAQKALSSVKKTFQDLQKNEYKTTLFSLSEEASMLLAKVEYVQGNHQACLAIYDTIHLSSPEAIVQMYKKKMFSEAFAIKGLCMELELSKSIQQENNLLKIIDCYQNSAKFLLEYLKELEKVIPSFSINTEDHLIGYFSETAIFRCIILYLKQRNLMKGVKFSRDVLRSMHSFLPLRTQQVMSCKLAMILLRGSCAEDYALEKIVDSPTRDISFVEEKVKFQTSSTAESSFPANTPNNLKPKFFVGEKKFNPSCIEQEVILLLLISEIMLNIDPVLDMSPEHGESREETLCNAETTYNLLTIVCSYLGQFDLLSNAIEKSLKYAFDRHHIWQQFALSLSLASKESQALPCLSECCQIKPSEPSSALMAAKLCYGQVPPKLEQGLRYAELALKMSDECFSHDGMKSRAHLCVGVGLSLKAIVCLGNVERLSFRTGAIKSYALAHTTDPYDHTPLKYFAYELALVRKLSLAVNKVKQALALQPEDKFSLHLFVLLLTARQQYDEARQALDEAIQMYPNDVPLLATKCQLTLLLGDENEALQACSDLMKQWKNLAATNQSLNVDSGGDHMTSDRLSVANASFGAEIESGSVLANSVVASRYGPTMSDVTSSLADLQPIVSTASSARTEGWLQVADVYLALDKVNEAEKCINEAIQIHPLHPSVLYMRGRLLEHHNELVEACNMYNNALIIDPFHEKATESLAGALCRQNKLGFAKKLVQDALIQGSNSHTMWRYLADILEEEGDAANAIECSSFALKLEESSPIVPFSTMLIPSL